MSNNQTIKNLRVKNNETSISQVLPIGADAVNVELANRRNLQETIGNIDSRVNGSITNNLEVLSSAIQTLDSIKADTAMIGSPLVAGTASEMTDTSHIYVYTGNESGYTNGNWYYYDGTIWASGGVYNSTAVETDKTLKVENVAADSRAAGNIVLVSQTQPAAASNKIWIDPDAREIEIPTMDDVPSIEEFNELKDDLSHKADINGTYPDLVCGQILSDKYITNRVPYLFRATGDGRIGEREYLEIVGGSVGWNQLVDMTDVNKLTQTACTIASNNNKIIQSNITSGSISRWGLVTGFPDLHHKVLVSGNATSSADGMLKLWKGSWTNTSLTANIKTNFTYLFDMLLSTNPTDVPFGAYFEDGTGVTVEWENCIVCDITILLGSTIADYIYALETATAGAGVAKLKSWGFFTKDYYTYDAGSLKSVEGLESHDTVGFNAYDNSTGKALVVGGHEYQITGTYTAISLDGTSITPDSNGCFTPSADGELTITGGNGTDTCVHLTWSGYRNGEYEPYVKHSYPLDSSLTLRGIPKKDADGNLYFDGDVYQSDGKVQRRYGERAYQSGDESLADAITDGTTTIYKLATPTTETADPFQSPQIVDDFGTEEFVTDSIVPVGHNTKYPANLRDKLQHLPSPTRTDGYYAIHEDGEQMTLSPLPAEIPSAPSTDGTYVLKATVSSGTVTLTWDEE